MTIQIPPTLLLYAHVYPDPLPQEMGLPVSRHKMSASSVQVDLAFQGQNF
jgi:hypothetical protein